MKKLLILLLFLTACTQDKHESVKAAEYWEQRNMEGHIYSKTVWGKCFESWAGYTYLIEKNDGKFLVDDNNKYPSTQFCTLYKECDYVYKKHCVMVKHCSEYAAAGFVEQKIKEMKMKPIKCPKGIR